MYAPDAAAIDTSVGRLEKENIGESTGGEGKGENDEER